MKDIVDSMIGSPGQQHRRTVALERREASPPIYTCLVLIPSGSGTMRLPRSSTLVQGILNGPHATLPASARSPAER
ncbi:hypothetical protein [Caballeronia sp. ATUFL_F1_KS39]|uniref:hypothetical protein n=1 Tax=Caballeronia sp. ATUFL_F1_KS39 TaxID=2921766 RepID=UPI0020297374|nr:hypothetical protein [Caballeronia sp. ATUFL_F1_KS39]